MKTMIKKQVSKSTNAVKNMLNIIGANITSISNGGKRINAQSTFNAEIRDISNIHQYGLVSFPYEGIPVIVMNGDNEYVVLGFNDKNSPKVKYGESCLYSKFNNYILLKDDGSIEIKSDGCEISIANNDILFTTPTKTVSINEICTRLGI